MFTLMIYCLTVTEAANLRQQSISGTGHVLQRVSVNKARSSGVALTENLASGYFPNFFDSLGWEQGSAFLPGEIAFLRCC